MAKTKAEKSIKVHLIWVLIALLAVAGATFAWFSFKTSTNIEPNTAGAVTDGEASLLISNSPDGPFGKECTLKFISAGGDLEPVSTADLDDFYKAGAQNAKGISILFSDATDEIDDVTMHGKLYLKCEGGAVDVYLYKPKMTFGKDVQAIASMRLGIRTSGNGSTNTYIFRLDDMTDTSSAEKTVTTTQENVVVKSVTSGAADFAKDSALNISDYTAIGSGANDESPKAGKNRITTVKSGQTVTVEYILYLEGCDENCINSVQNKDVSLALSFAGSTVK